MENEDVRCTSLFLRSAWLLFGQEIRIRCFWLMADTVPRIKLYIVTTFFPRNKRGLDQFLFGYSVTWKMGMIKEGGGTKNTPYHFSYVTKLSHNLVEVEVQFLLLVNKASRIFCVQSVHSNKVNFHFLNVSLSLTFGILSHHARSQILHCPVTIGIAFARAIYLDIQIYIFGQFILCEMKT